MYLKANTLADAVTSVISEGKVHIIELIVEHYVNHLLNTITDEEIDWMCGVVNIVMSSHEHECDQLKAKYKYHLLMLLDKPVKSLNSPDINRVVTHPNPLLLFNDKVSVDHFAQ